MNIRRSLVVNATTLEVRIALLENGQLAELYQERHTRKSLVGRIYRGRVSKMLPGIESAFIDIGGDRDGFLYLDDQPLTHLDDADLSSEFHSPAISVPPIPLLPPIQTGDDLLVQVIKDPIGSKGARLTRHINFPGRYLVYLPYGNHIGISRKFTDEAERERLRSLIHIHSETPEGFIVRTAAMGEKDEDLIADIALLREQWRTVQAAFGTPKGARLIWEDVDLIGKILRDKFREEVQSLWVDDLDTHRDILQFVSQIHPSWTSRIRLYTSPLPIFEAFEIESEITRALQPKVLLKHGGSLVFNQTEALVSIDVNTGAFSSHQDLETTVTQANLLAIPEIVRQLRLRNHGGIIVIDFIDMMDLANQQMVHAALVSEFERDRQCSRIGPLSIFGLVELTRKRTGPSLERSMTLPCPSCQGSGRVPNLDMELFKIYRELLPHLQIPPDTLMRISVHPHERPLLQGTIWEEILTLGRKQSLRIEIVDRMDQGHFNLSLQKLTSVTRSPSK